MHDRGGVSASVTKNINISIWKAPTGQYPLAPVQMCLHRTIL
jgi:hypothetical protein